MRSHLIDRAAAAAFIHARCRPQARLELARWEQRARAIPDRQRREQALMSIHTKGFHCEGGAVFAAGAPGWCASLVPATVAFQTLVDYLDNLSDRMGYVSAATLRRLHGAVADALAPGAAPQAYTDGPDDEYLRLLVAETQARLAELPGYGAVADACAALGARYAELQVHKHLPDITARVPALVDWLGTFAAGYPGWRWWELAAACGSTLAIFALFLAATRPGAPEAGRLVDLYFPWVGGLHILLDYYIDQAEDDAGGDLNFVRPYGGARAAADGLRTIFGECLRRVRALPDPTLHLLIVQGLPGLYLSDAKVARQGLGSAARQILSAGGLGSFGAYWYCRACRPIR